ncbi:hypothetical protein B0H12DRAFT_1243200 [Mycena haematopus]|nr:hypothetical protein B0H12DRAFT_1243200 [Mycena haematopus]
MIISWLAIANLVIIAAGTGVNKDIVHETMSSAVLKNGKYEVFYDTGSFGSEASSLQEKYIRRFIPPMEIIPKEVVKRNIFPALIARTVYWLKGRPF